MSRYVAAFALALCSAALLLDFASPSSAQPAPSPIPTPVTLPTVPPSPKLDPLVQFGVNVLIDMARHQLANRANSAAGTVTYFKRFSLEVETGPNQYRNVRLHQGTIINPRGGSIAPGQRVEVGGHADSDGVLDADTITIDE